MRKTKRSKTKRRNRKHNYLGKARIKYYSIKKGGEGPDSNRSRTPRSNRSRTPRSNRNITLRSNRSRTPAQSSSQSAMKAEAVAEATASRLSPVVPDINDNPMYTNIYNPTDRIVVARRAAVARRAVKLREAAQARRKEAGTDEALKARYDAHAQVLRTKMAASSITEQMMAKAADEAEVKERVRAHAARLRLRLR